jgi:outer membrane protein assembly factor BamB
MGAGGDTAAAAPTGARRPRLGAALGLVTACTITLAVLPYAWGRVLVLGMMDGLPEAPFVALLEAGLLAVLGLAVGLASRPRGRGRPLVAGALLACWVVVNAVLIWLFSGDVIPRSVTTALFVLSGLWVVWLAWLPYWPLPWPPRLGILTLCAAAAFVFPLLLRTDGLTGDARVCFTWRARTSPDPGLSGVTRELPPGRALVLPPAGPDDFAHFLGPLGQGVVPRARLGRAWQARPPRQLWRRPVGAGWGGFAVVGPYAFTQEQRGPWECVVCYRTADGAELWVRGDPIRFESSMGGPGPRATPAVAAGRVYAVGAAGLLNCLDAGTGRRLWAVNIQEDNQAQSPVLHGVSGSPLAVGDRVIVSPTGANGISLAAYDARTGKRLWRGGRDQSSYGSPLLAEIGGVRQVLLFNSVGVAGHELRTGSLLWTFPWTNAVGVNCSQPIPNAGGPGRVYAATGYGRGSALFQVAHSAGAGWSAGALWTKPVMRTKFTTAVLHRGHVYGLDDGILGCQDLATGRRRWKDGRYGHGQVLLAGGLLLVQAEDGTVVLVDPSPDGLRELGRVDALAGKTWNNPALAGRLLLVRNDREAACYELPGPG